MSEPFLIAFRESIQGSVLLGLVLSYPSVLKDRGFYRSLLFGAVTAFLAGFLLGYLPNLTRNIMAVETWSFWRYVAESVIFYSGMVIYLARPAPKPRWISAGLFMLGFLILFFEARSLGFLVQDMGAMKENASGALVSALAGIAAGFLPLFLFRKYLKKISSDSAFTVASLLITIGALQFGMGGVGELERENILAPLQRNLISFISLSMESLQSLLLISDHPFLNVPLSGLARFLAGDRTALALTLAFIMVPPLFLLTRIFSSPDPVTDDLQAGARKRYTIAFFRKELISRTIPVMTSFVVLVVLLHAVNVSLNPLYEPPPVPVREGEIRDMLRIPLSDRTGSFDDKKMRKYVYYYGSKQIIFIAMLRPDGTPGVALDECEICRPADWNTDAKGYAQKGEHLICKYCMTPIATATLNNPGGCNPIPIPFKVEDSVITIRVADLIATFNKLQELEKKGTHL